MKKLILTGLGLGCLAAIVPAHAGGYNMEQVRAIMKRDFKPKGQAGLDRIDQDGVQALCTASNNNPPEAMAKKLEADQMASVKWPANGKLIGDWKKGEKLAQSGRGMTWSDKPETESGGNCYNCHKIDPKEVSHGTIGPTLTGFGKTRGYTVEMQKYAYSKIYDAKTHNLCTTMPRFGAAGALSPEQVTDLVALLMDPNSPVNK